MTVRVKFSRKCFGIPLILNYLRLIDFNVNPFDGDSQKSCSELNVNTHFTGILVTDVFTLTTN